MPYLQRDWIAPMTAAPLDDLIARVEAATGPDRELDLAIMREVSGNDWRWYFRKQATITYDQYGYCAAGNPVCTLEEFTGSLVDAVTLVPEGHAWQVGCDIDLTPVARVWGHDMDFTEIAATPELALVAACLKARRAALAANDDGDRE